MSHLAYPIHPASAPAPLQQQYAKKLGSRPVVHKIPLHTTRQYPLPAMHIDESSLDGTLEVIETIMCRHLGLSSEDIEAHGIVLAHEDNLTTSLVRKAQGAWQDNSNTFEALGETKYKYSGCLWKENALLGCKAITAGWKAKKLPPFPPSHELIHLPLHAHILDAYQILSKQQSLEQWAASKPTWEDIEWMSYTMLDNFCSGGIVDKMRWNTLLPEIKEEQQVLDLIEPQYQYPVTEQIFNPVTY
ncbi:hypothetical protein FRC04_010222 [Tulasnella sp. 424]|nr:hypothetical protein FRC04_010222 [Tulasnella sp. 424]